MPWIPPSSGPLRIIRWGGGFTNQDVFPAPFPSQFACPTPTIKGGAQRIFPQPLPSQFVCGPPVVVGGANPGVALYVGGTLFPILVEGASDPIPGAGAATRPSISSQTIGRWTFQCDTFIQNNTLVPQVGQTVQLFDYGQRRFMGCINDVVSELLTGSHSYMNGVTLESGQVIHHLTCIDKSGILDHRVINVVYLSGSDVADAVRNILFVWCAGEGITATTLPLTLTPLDADEQFYFVSAAQALDKLATDTACVWWVDQQGDLHFVAIVSLPACPYTLNTANISGTNPAVRAISVKTTLLDYRNYEIVTSNLQTLPAAPTTLSISETYTLPQAAATAAGFYLGCCILNLPIGQITSLTVNGVSQPTYLGSAGYNFRHAWWYFPGAPYLYAPNVTNDVPAFPAPPVTSPDPIAGDVVVITYVPWAPSGSPTQVVQSVGIAVGSPLTAPGGTCGSGIYQVVDQVHNVNLQSDLNAIAIAILARSGGVPKFLQFETDVPGAQVGQLIVATIPELNVSPADSLMITSIQMSDMGSNLGYGSAFRSVITARTGQDFGNQIKWFERLVARTENAQPVLQYEYPTFVLAPGGSVAAGVNLTNPYIEQRSGRLVSLTIAATTGPVGQNLIIDILANGLSIFGSPKPQLLAGQTLTTFTGPFAQGVATFVFAQDVLTITATYGITGTPTAQAAAVTVQLKVAI